MSKLGPGAGRNGRSRTVAIPDKPPAAESREKLVYTFAIDPGQNRTGIAIFANKDLFNSFWVDPWMGNLTSHLSGYGIYAAKKGSPASFRAVVEVPQHGTHQSRGGVHFGAGMVVADLVTLYGLKRNQVKRVKPSQWRKAIFGKAEGTSDEWKERAVRKAIEMYEDYGLTDHNEAEAILLGHAFVNGLLR